MFPPGLLHPYRSVLFDSIELFAFQLKITMTPKSTKLTQNVILSPLVSFASPHSFPYVPFDSIFTVNLEILLEIKSDRHPIKIFKNHLIALVIGQL